jgi:hypothetical protein
MRKRSYDSTHDAGEGVQLRNKRTKQISSVTSDDEDLSDEWIAASRVRNYILNDPLLDWFNMYESHNQSAKLINNNQSAGVDNPEVNNPSVNNQLAGVNNPSVNNQLAGVNNQLAGVNNLSVNNQLAGVNNQLVGVNKPSVNNQPRMSSTGIESFHSFIMSKGVEFENIIMLELTKRVGSEHIVTVADFTQARSEVKYLETLYMMQRGVPIIYQGVLRNYETKTFGMPDLIVRSDWVNKLTDTKAMSNEMMNLGSPMFNHGYHYVIVDIKHSTLNLTANGKTLLNQRSIPAFKGQVYIYHKALAKIQRYEPSCAYLLGRRWKYTTCKKEYKGYNAFERLGVIDFMGFDRQYISKTNDAVKWLRKVLTQGALWSVDPKPTVPELYPNMSNSYDGIWHQRKSSLAEQLEEITLLWNCGVRQRQLAHSAGIFSYHDCTPEILGFKEKHSRYNILKMIIEVNKRDNTNLILPTKLTKNLHNWRTVSNVEYFVDFESLNDIGFVPDIEESIIDTVFMIGVVRVTNGVLSYTSFVIDELTDTEENRIFNDFMNYIKLPNGEFPNIYVWGDFERINYEKRAEKYNWDNTIHPNKWINFIKIMKSEPIVIKGALNYGLKSIAKAMYSHKMIATIWPENSVCKNGLDAMIAAWNCSKISSELKVPLSSVSTMGDIINYNRIDCQVVYEIMSYLRKI